MTILKPTGPEAALGAFEGGDAIWIVQAIDFWAAV